MKNKANQEDLDKLEAHCNETYLPKIEFKQFLQELTEKDGVATQEFSERNAKIAQLEAILEKV